MYLIDSDPVLPEARNFLKHSFNIAKDEYMCGNDIGA